MNNNYIFNIRILYFFIGCWKIMEIILVLVVVYFGLIYFRNNLLVLGDFYIVGLVIRLGLMRNRYS